jgi:hypothetical protein
MTPKDRPRTARCFHCGGRFGLVRQRLLTFQGYLNFCSLRCKEAHCRRIEDEAKRRKALDYLAKPS